VTAPAHPSSFWRRRLVDPIRAQLTQGVTPDQIALTLAFGTVGGLFPFVGLTTLLCFLLALVWRLNQPVIHVVNQLLWPVQLALIPVYATTGARLYGAPALPFDLTEVVRVFRESPREFWARFGLLGLHAFTAWLLSVPVLVAAIYFPFRRILRRIASALPQHR
jgi:hypothetical protein